MPDAGDIALSNAGLQCPGCSYRLDGLTEQRCPECGQSFDPQALAVVSPWYRSSRAAALASAASVIISATSVWWCVDATLLYAREMGGWCGTGRLAARMTIECSPGLWVPLFGCLFVTRLAGQWIAPARVALSASIAAFVISYGATHFTWVQDLAVALAR